MTNKPLAFVIMPFGDEFDPIYDEFIKPTLTEAGYEVERADDMENQRNILSDVVEGIYKSNLIVADLTTTNPNVFYELGLAHAFKKPVIHITQSIDEVPFDLKSQRLMEYSVHFSKINEAKETLTSYATGAKDGSTKFGSPVTDFLPEEPSFEPRRNGPPPIDDALTNDLPTNDALKSPDEDTRGFLDHLIAINDGYNRIAQIVQGVGVDLEEMTLSTNTTTDEFTQIGITPSASSPAAARNASRKLATQISEFNSKLKKANAEYSSIAQETEDSLEFVVSFQREQLDANNPDVDEQLESLHSLRTAVIEGRDSFLILAEIMDGLPRIERRLNREVARASEEIRVMASNLDRTIASISRALSHHD